MIPVVFKVFAKGLSFIGIKLTARTYKKHGTEYLGLKAEPGKAGISGLIDKVKQMAIEGFNKAVGGFKKVIDIITNFVKLVKERGPLAILDVFNQLKNMGRNTEEEMMLLGYTGGGVPQLTNSASSNEDTHDEKPDFEALRKERDEEYARTRDEYFNKQSDFWDQQTSKLASDFNTNLDQTVAGFKSVGKWMHPVANSYRLCVEAAVEAMEFEPALHHDPANPDVAPNVFLQLKGGNKNKAAYAACADLLRDENAANDNPDLILDEDDKHSRRTWALMNRAKKKLAKHQQQNVDLLIQDKMQAGYGNPVKAIAGGAERAGKGVERGTKSAERGVKAAARKVERTGKEVGHKAERTGKEVANKAERAAKETGQKIKEKAIKVKQAAERAGKAIERKAKEAANWAKNLKNKFLNKLKEAANAAKAAVRKVADKVKEKAEEVWNAVKSGFLSVINEITNTVKSAIEKLKCFFNWLKENLPYLKSAEVSDIYIGCLVNPGGCDMGKMRFPSIALHLNKIGWIRTPEGFGGSAQEMLNWIKDQVIPKLKKYLDNYVEWKEAFKLKIPTGIDTGCKCFDLSYPNGLRFKSVRKLGITVRIPDARNPFNYGKKTCFIRPCGIPTGVSTKVLTFYYPKPKLSAFKGIAC